MEHIDYSKFRFRIGDKILYKGEQYIIKAYYFFKGFNNYTDSYGYTISLPLHSGVGFSYSEYGKPLKFEYDSCFYVSEDSVSKDLTLSTDNFTINDLKPGMIVETCRSGFGLIMLNTKNELILVGKNIYTEGSIDKCYNLDLTPKHSYSNNLNINAIYYLKKGVFLDEKLFNKDNLSLIWKRSEVLELSIDEIAKKFNVDPSLIRIKKD